jgi:hypothetical protein
MKAIIFSGHIRTLEKIYDNFDFIDTDIYINTYDEFGYWNGDTSIYKNDTKIDNEYIYNIFKKEDKDKVKDIYIESINCKIEIIELLSKKMENKKIYYTRPYNWISMHMKRLTSIERFFLIKDKNYDSIYLLRPDFIFTKSNLVDIHLIKNDYIYIEGCDNYSGNQTWLNDFFFIGNENHFLLLKNIYIESVNSYINDYNGEYDPHSYFCFLIKKYFEKYEFIECGGNSKLLNTPNGYCIPIYS